MCEEIQIRTARHEDYDDIMEIGDVYGGRDYLPSMFHMFLDDPNIYAIVAEVDCKPVGFYLLHVLDGGESAVKRGGRVNTSFRKRGIFHLMTESLNQKLLSIEPPVKRLSFSTTNFVDRAAGEFTDEGYVEVLRKDFNIDHRHTSWRGAFTEDNT
ncbi:histidine N-acetyltransferase [Aplysia californica]|uniref:Histidine N-acetyltransferase n=1 Tax=Aplysia californica TaxID=6500 RepID=A0ABM0JSW5_APLCA|nr:histidine N-acetyltransferase [Aplysia californica]